VLARSYGQFGFSMKCHWSRNRVVECVDQSPPEVMARLRGDEAGENRGTGVRAGARRDATVLIREVGDRLCPYNPCRGHEMYMVGQQFGFQLVALDVNASWGWEIHFARPLSFDGL
jgi:hypothetical protein